MLSLCIEIEDATTDGLLLKLECIADRLKSGYTRGEGFDMRGDEEAPEEEEADTCSRCGNPNDDGEGYDGLCGNCADRKEGEGTDAD